VFTARYALSPYIKQTRFVFKGLNEIFNIQALYVSIICVAAAVNGHITWHMRSVLITRETCRAFTMQYARNQAVTKRVLSKHPYSLTPINRTLMIRIANYADRLSPSGNFVENSTKIIYLETPGYQIEHSTVKCYGCT
jgi:uncharacterized membrane protein YozB (DUF420 family)